MHIRTTGIGTVLVALGILALGWPTAAPAATLPGTFSDQLLTATPGSATALALVPDGRILITTRVGAVRVYKNGALRPTPALDLGPRVCSEIERGLVGIAIDPAFADQHYVYLYYTHKEDSTCGTVESDPASQPENRVSRFVLDDNDVMDPASEQVLVDNIPSVAGIHNAGDLHFGNDGYLYVSVGDGGCDYSGVSGCGASNNAARYPHVLSGKILRISSDGEVPPNNPYLGPGTARCNITGRTTPGTWCQEIYASGLRNPFRFAFDPNVSGTRFYINDVGLAAWEEIDLGQEGADYGWNVREGHCATNSTTDCGPPPAEMTNPLYDYDHSGGCSAITGGAFVPDGVWPVSYDGSYLFADFVCGKIFQLVSDDAGGFTSLEFASGLQYPVSMTFAATGPARGLYYLGRSTVTASFGLNRIFYTGGGNRAPSAEAAASPTSGNLALAVHFDAAGSADPDGDSLTYDWDFGDGSAHGSAAAVDHTYSTGGTFTATLRVSDGRGGEDTRELRIDAGNNAPSPTITSPLAAKLFSVGEDITLSGGASDPEDGPLASSALSWEVVRHHATHAHPYLPPTAGDGVHILAPQPEDLSSVTNSYLEIRLTATDSRGLSTTLTQNLRPQQVSLGFATIPSGLRLDLNGTMAPPSITSWAGWNLTVTAPSPQTGSSGSFATFASWSDGGAGSHPITTPASATSYTATFTENYPRPKGGTPVVASLVPAYSECLAPNWAHAPPWVYGSCTPPAQASDNLTVGTGGASGRPANMVGSIRVVVDGGDPATPADEADARIRVSITDVRNKADGSDYDGEVQVSASMRITDRDNGPTSTGTMQDAVFPVAVPCAATVEPMIGSTCFVDTSFDAIVPGVVTEGKRAIWELGQLEVYDGGADGRAATAPNTLFAVQGVFAP